MTQLQRTVNESDIRNALVMYQVLKHVCAYIRSCVVVGGVPAGAVAVHIVMVIRGLISERQGER